MRKITALILATVLVLSMGIGVLARYEVCPDCQGRMTETITEKVVGHKPCSKTDDPDMVDDIIEVKSVLRCTKCGTTETSTYRYTDCSH